MSKEVQPKEAFLLSHAQALYLHGLYDSIGLELAIFELLEPLDHFIVVLSLIQAWIVVINRDGFSWFRVKRLLDVVLVVCVGVHFQIEKDKRFKKTLIN